MSPLVVALLVLVLLLAAGYGLLNGMRDAPNAIALPVRSRALTPGAALLLAATMNLLGGVLSGGLLTAVWRELPPAIPDGGPGLVMALVPLAVAIAWGDFAWRRGMPISMTHALIVGLVGAGLALTITGHASFEGVWSPTLITAMLLGLVLSPVLAWFLSWVLVTPATWAARDAAPGAVNHAARMSLSVSGAANALGHGVQSGQRITFMVAIAYSAIGRPEALEWWVPVAAGASLALGTLFGGWRIAHTLTDTLVRLDPLRSAVASIVSAGLLFVGSFALHLPLSSTHSATAAIIGAGENQRYTAVRWPQVQKVVHYWLATLVVPALAALILAAAASPLF
ncbi:inorganic phosphate transporter [Citricoccus nitrophenolicus]|uniref:Inorganic phosphate transporter n=1 Tax=Citricoccus nitrophenolicus TaxID=863575 RepID=A0ABV0IG97_9MICC